MSALNQYDKSTGNLLRVLLHLAGVAAVFFFLVFVRYPALINADYFFDYDEAFMAVQILDFLKGGPFSFFYEGANYHGVLGGLTAVPFMGLFGDGSLAYKLPGSLYYALYIWTTFLLARKIAPGAGGFVILLMLFPPVAVFEITLRNWPHTEISFIGNVLFLLFIRTRTLQEKKAGPVFFLGVVMGFAIYSYTYAILHVFAVLLLFILTHERWENLRPLFSFNAFCGLFRNLEGKRQVLARILDVIMVFFLGGIVFSYVFGGFGLDIAGYSILQINQLHKPVFQLLILLILRLAICRDPGLVSLDSFKRWVQSLPPTTTRTAGFGVLGFLIGLSPRIAAIVLGEIKKGGQGFDMDFMPVRLVQHFWSLVTVNLPQILGVRQPFVEGFSAGTSRPFQVILGMVSILLLALMVWSTISYLKPYKGEWGKIFKMRKIRFHPALILPVFALLVLVSVTVTQFGPVTRYLLPLYGVAAIFVAFLLVRIRRASWMGCLVLIALWVGYYATTTCQLYARSGVLSGASVVRLAEHPLHQAIRFFASHDIRTVYTSYYYSSLLTFFSGGKVEGTEYSKTVRGKRQRARSALNPRFAILLKRGNVNDREVFRNYLSRNRVQHRTDPVGPYLILWNFKGETDAIEPLRSLID